MLITECIPCQYGQHDDHYRVVQPVPDGMMGGAECHCEGECRDRLQPRCDCDDWCGMRSCLPGEGTQ